MGVARTYLDEVAANIRDRVPPGDLPHDDTVGLFRSYAVLLLAKGEDVTAGDVHNAWVAWMLDRGQEHEALVPFDELQDEVAAMDTPFVEAIHEAARVGQAET